MTKEPTMLEAYTELVKDQSYRLLKGHNYSLQQELEVEEEEEEERDRANGKKNNKTAIHDVS